MADPDTSTGTAATGSAVKSTPAKTGWLDESKDLIKTIVYAVLIALGFRSVAYEPFNIPSESMLPGLMVGDYLFVSKFPYGYSRYSFPLGLAPIDGRIFGGDVERGDVIVFKLPKDNSTDYIKRVIGLPGDVVEMRQGTVYINGKPIQRERVEDRVMEVSPNTDCVSNFPFYRVSEGNGKITCRYPQFRETLPDGRSYMTLDLIPDGLRDTTRPFFVPAGHYFVLGDNRDYSADSRLTAAEDGVGFLPAENIVGRAEFLFFSTNGEAQLWTPWKWHKTVRWDRLFQAVE
ncbi:MAG TPA: signal peptidase I [Pedomonas sp.]|uniref:signal peptidase I n=1 Tax=Pedomonas sp. TaxID=2976421 RepID=UPI002F3F33C7